MRVSGYTWAANVVGKLLPYEAAIRSLLLICDEVWVAYDPRFDSADIFTSIDPRVNVIEHPFRIEEITGNGEQLTRARKQCSGDWVFWLDLDEIIHEKNVEQIKTDLNYADANGCNFLLYSCCCPVALKYVFRTQWEIRAKFTRNIDGLIHGFEATALRRREDGGKYLDHGDGIDYIKNGTRFYNNILEARDDDFFHKVKNHAPTISKEDVYTTLDLYPHIYHYARYSFQRKIKMNTYGHFAYHLGLSDDYDPGSWIKTLSDNVVLEPAPERHNEDVVGPLELSHPAVIQPWVDMINSVVFLPEEIENG